VVADQEAPVLEAAGLFKPLDRCDGVTERTAGEAGELIEWDRNLLGK
jgi:hypothetical protein